MRGMNKRASAVGEGMVTVYRIVMVSLIALVVFGVYSIFYVYELDIRETEALILSRGSMECLSEGGLSLEKVKSLEDDFLESCGYGGLGRVYARVEFLRDGEIVRAVSQGDSGLIWIRDLLDSSDFEGTIQRYKVGYVNSSVNFSYSDGVSGSLNMEVLVDASNK